MRKRLGPFSFLAIWYQTGTQVHSIRPKKAGKNTFRSNYIAMLCQVLIYTPASLWIAVMVTFQSPGVLASSQARDLRIERL